MVVKKKVIENAWCQEHNVNHQNYCDTGKLKFYPWRASSYDWQLGKPGCSPPAWRASPSEHLSPLSPEWWQHCQFAGNSNYLVQLLRCLLKSEARSQLKKPALHLLQSLLVLSHLLLHLHDQLDYCDQHDLLFQPGALCIRFSSIHHLLCLRVQSNKFFITACWQ